MQEIVNIERMSYGPCGIGHLASGKAIFVSGAIQGDSALVRITEEKKSFARGICEKIEEPSPLRVENPKITQASAIHPWAQLSYAAQLAAKESNVRYALTHTAHLPEEQLENIMEPIASCKNEWGYRNKLELAVTHDDAGRFALGFHQEGSPHIDIATNFPLGNRLIEKSPKALTGVMRYIAGKQDLGIYRIGVRGSIATKSIEVALWTPPCSFPRSFAAQALQDATGATSVVRVIADAGSARKVKQVEVLAGKGFWQENMVIEREPQNESEKPEVVRFDISAPSFFQVNTSQAAYMVKRVMQALNVEEDAYIADLYAGAGTFSIPLARAGADVVAIEREGSSTRDFRRNCKNNHVDVEIICDDVEKALPEVVEAGQLAAVVVDPPRAGLEANVIQIIASASPEKVAYVSCDPQTLARDIDRFAAYGYAPTMIQAVDMFPQTYHVETICILAHS